MSMAAKQETEREITARDIEHGKLVINYRETSIPGVCVAEATLPRWPAPVGTVWCRHSGNTAIEILQSYVVEDVRRCGIRTKIQEAIAAWWPHITHIKTARGTKEGLGWLKAMGYKKQANGDWIYKVPRKRK